MSIMLGSGLITSDSPAFSPIDISGLKMWLKADALALANNDPVASWLDSSGNGNAAVNADVGTQPQFKTNAKNGLPIVLFNSGFGTSLTTAGSISNSQSFTIVAVMSDEAGGERSVVEWGGSSGRYYFINNVQRWDAFFAATGGSGGNTITGTGFHLIAWTQSQAGDWVLYDNGAVDASGNNPQVFGNGGLIVGAAPVTRNFGGPIAEILCFDSVLSPTNLSNLFSYENTKWAIY